MPQLRADIRLQSSVTAGLLILIALSTALWLEHDSELISAPALIVVAALGCLCLVLVANSRTQRRTEQMLTATRDEARAASRAKTDFLANMSHEIRTPMTAILGYADLLGEKADAQPGGPSRDEAVETIRRNAQHLLVVINDILDLSKIEAGRMPVLKQPVSTVDLVHGVVRLMDERAHHRGLALRLAFANNVPAIVDTDPTRLRQILINLLGNAIKFTEHGAVTLTVCRSEAAPRELEFQIADTGIGMTDTQLDRLYTPFMQADTSTTRQFGGTGLGLAITRRCVDMLGGRIHVKSAHGGGTTFTFTIDAGDVDRLNQSPSASAIDTAPLPTKRDRPTAHGAPLPPPLEHVRILLAEDGEDNQRLIRFHLQRAGAEVVVVENGAQAIEAVHSARTEDDAFDAVLMDMQMPVMDGYSAVRMLAAAGERVPCIALTAHAMEGDREKCMAAGCVDYICKPVDNRTLVATIRRAVKHDCSAILPRTSPR